MTSLNNRPIRKIGSNTIARIVPKIFPRIPPLLPELVAVDHMAAVRHAQLHDRAGVSDETYSALERQFSAPEILELTITAGWYHTISFVINAARVQPEPWAARFPTVTPRDG